MEHGLTTEHPFVHSPYTMATWPTKNTIVDQRSIKKRPGYDTIHKNLGAGIEPLHILIYLMKDGTRFTLYLTETDLIQKETSGSNTWSYKTETGDYNSTIASISGATVTGKAGTTFSTDGVAAGDKFILDTDHSSQIEEDTNWGTILTVDTELQLTLTASYSGTTGSWGGSEKNALIRKVYTTPSNERWSWAVVGDKFCFTNGNTDVQYWAGTGYAADLETGAAVATKARYCIEYANRLILADYGSTRDPLGVAWSKEGDPTDWTDSTAGAVQLLETEDIITGLGKIGGQLIVYKRNSIFFWYRTGESTAPIARASYREGIGCIAPYSIVKYLGTNAFLGRDNFYKLVGNEPVAIGTPIRDKFFELTGQTEAEQTWGFVDTDNRLIHWLADTSDGQYAFVWNYQTEEWTVFQYHHEIKCGGKGAL